MAYRKKAGWLVAALAVGFLLVPFSYSEARQSETGLSALECERLSALDLDGMSRRQQQFAQECDTVEASHDWEQQYGSLNEMELAAAVVYE